MRGAGSAGREEARSPYKSSEISGPPVVEVKTARKRHQPQAAMRTFALQEIGGQRSEFSVAIRDPLADGTGNESRHPCLEHSQPRRRRDSVTARS